MKHFSTLVIATLLGCLAPVAVAADKLVILSPHRKSIQDEYLPAFKAYYKSKFGTEVEIDWLDQGGTSNDVRFLRSQFARNPASAGIDLFWGGGAPIFVELSADKLLQSYTLPAPLNAEIPKDVAGVPLFDATATWYASAFSSFGIMTNRKILALDKLPVPAKWEDIADSRYYNQLSLADPRQSGTANTMNMIVLQALGWDKGWDLLTRIGGNTRKFTHSSSDPIKAVVAGDAAAAMAVDFYARPKVDELGSDKIGFILPEGQTVLDADPIALVKGAPNLKVAQRFVDFVLSADGQKLLIYKKGLPQGPKLAPLGRMAVNPKAYDGAGDQLASTTNPFAQATFAKIDLAKTSELQRPFSDLIGATVVDVHEDLKKAWQAVIKRGLKPEEVAELTRAPVSEGELLQLSKQWDNEVLRNQTINSWVEKSKAKYKKLSGTAG